jgi:hypothetical protein
VLLRRASVDLMYMGAVQGTDTAPLHTGGVRMNEPGGRALYVVT